MRSSITTLLIAASLALGACGGDTPAADTKTASTATVDTTTVTTAAAITPTVDTAIATTATTATANTPTADELTQALKTKLHSDHSNIDARIETMDPGLERRKLAESLQTQRDQLFIVKQINECVVLANTEPQQQSCNVFLDISTKYQKNSQTRHVLMNVSEKDGLWVMNKLSIAPRR